MPFPVCRARSRANSSAIGLRMQSGMFTASKYLLYTLLYTPYTFLSSTGARNEARTVIEIRLLRPRDDADELLAEGLQQTVPYRDLDEAKEGDASQERRRQAETKDERARCFYCVPGKNRPVVVIARAEDDPYYLVCPLTSETPERISQCDSRKRPGVRLGEVLGNGKRSVAKIGSVRIYSASLARRQVRTLDPQCMGLLLKEIYLLRLGQGRS